MPTLAPKLDPDFKQRVAKLAAQRKAADQSFKDAVLTYLDFCRDYAKLFAEAKSPAAKAYLHEQTGMDEPSVRSMYKRIGEQYPVLKKHVKYLPASQESLKELARAEHRKEGTIEKLVAKELLTSDASVADVRAGVRKFTRKHAKPKEVATKTEDHQHVTVEFNGPRAKLIVALAEMLDFTFIFVKKDRAFYEDMKATAVATKRDNLGFV